MGLDDPYPVGAVDDRDRRVVTVPGQENIGARPTERQALDIKAVDELRQDRKVEADFALIMIEHKAEARLNQRKRRRRRPGLGRAGDGIADRSHALLASEAAEEFGQAAK